MMVEQAGDCIGFLGFLLDQYVGPCLLVKICVPEKKKFIRLFHYILLQNNEPLLYFSVQLFHEYF